MNGEANVLDYLGHYWLVLHQKLGFIKNTNAKQVETFHFVFIYDEIILNSDSCMRPMIKIVGFLYTPNVSLKKYLY